MRINGSILWRGHGASLRLAATAAVLVGAMMATSLETAQVASASSSSSSTSDAGSSCTVANAGPSHTMWGTTDSAAPLDMATTEGQVCRKFQTTRLFYNLGDTVINKESEALITSGHELIISIDAFTQSSGRQQIPYSQIANTTTWDSYFEQQFEAMQSSAPLTYFIFGHEADSLQDCAGLTMPACGGEFVQAWQKLHKLAASVGATHLRFVWDMEAWSYNPGSNHSGLPKASYFFPGVSYVDLIGEDGYNFSGCLQGSFQASQWETFAHITAAVNTWVSANAPGLDVAVIEWGSVENPADPNAKAEWITDTAALMQTPAYANWVLMSYWNQDDTSGPVRCHLQIDTSAAALDAYAAMGMETFFGGPSAGSTVTTTTLTSSASEVAAGESITLSATVAASGTSSEPTGTVTFEDAGVSVGTGTLASGGASLTLTPAAGSHGYTASYAGDTNDAASSSGTVEVTADGVSTTASLTSSNGDVPAGTGVTLTSSVAASDGSALSGSVTFATAAGTLGTVALQSGTASLPLTSSTAKTLSITATYGGDGTHTPSSSPVLTEVFSNPMAITKGAASPNPLVNITHITFSLSEAARVSIVVENSSGTIVTHRESDMKMSGNESFAYYALNDQSKRVAAGSYTVVISAADSAGNPASVRLPLSIS